ncbi:MAG: hypothetical protein IIV97_01345, partial [Oscillospiraceae bacterium]|nr:hypothetical protein [Oscillospiraceae bacterium]
VLAFVTIRKNKEVINIDFRTIKFSFKELREMMFIGVPAGLQTSLYSFANAVIASAVNSFGADATTGISIANQFDNLIYYVAFGPAVAATTYIAQNVGAKKIDRVKKAVLSSLFITIALSGICGSLFAVFSKQLSSIMSESPAVIAYARQKMVIISSLYFIGGINEMLGGALRGMGRPIIPTISTLLFMCLIRFVWVYVFFPLCPNLTFLYAIWPIGWVLSISMLLIAFFPTLRKLERDALVAQETV